MEEHREHLTDLYRTAGGLLLGRLTYEIWAKRWPAVKDKSDEIAHAINTMPKYVASTTLTDPVWSGTTVLRDDIPRQVRDLKQRSGGNLVLAGSAKLAHTLMVHDLVDVYVLMIHPVVLGDRKRLFEPGGRRAALTLTESRATAGGLAILTLARGES